MIIFLKQGLNYVCVWGIYIYIYVDYIMVYILMRLYYLEEMQ